MVTSIGSSDNSIQQLMAQMYSKMNKADTDGTSGLSKNELSSIDAGNDVGGSAFLQSLNEQFDSIDADQDGQLTSDEISKAKPTQDQSQMGPPAGMMIEFSVEDSSSSPSNSYSVMLKNLIDSLGLDINQDGKITADEIKEALGISDSDNEQQQTSTESGTSESTTGAESTSATQSVSKTSEGAGSGLSDFMHDLSGNFLQKLINSYQSGDGFASTLTSMI